MYNKNFFVKQRTDKIEINYSDKLFMKRYQGSQLNK